MISIIGNGKMALAIAKGLRDEEIEVVGRNEEKLKNFSKMTSAKYTLLEEFDCQDKTIILAIKPYALEELHFTSTAKEVISIMAGKKISQIRQHIQAHTYSRAMPNIAAEYLKSTTAVFGSEYAYEIFSKIGKAVKVNSENELDIATAIAGSGPAFLALVAEAIADGGVLCGLSREISYELTQGLFESFSAIDKSPSVIKDSVMSPAGTTASGYATLEDNKVRSAFIKAIRDAYNKSQQM
ncbi:MAG: pyrroline-5-carboxylate reductase [Epsilonproteobacteria bacterium]|nr:pyrroline-5-carboxylate reductase [Campylobacterota bacterium]